MSLNGRYSGVMSCEIMSSKDLKEIAKDLPKNWQVFHSKKSNRLYYYNTETNKTQWLHPSSGEKDNKRHDALIPQKHDETLKSKKRKATEDEKNKVKDEKTKQSNKKEEEPTQEQGAVKIKKEKTDCNEEVSMKIPKLTVKPFKLKAISKLPTNISSEKLQVQTSTPKLKTAYKEQPAQAKNKTQNEEVVEKMSKPQHLTRAKGIGDAASDSGVSDSSERLLAWLADTSRINFKDHPVPNELITEQKAQTSTPQPRTGNEKTEKQKSTTLERVKMSSDVSKERSDDILDRLVPKRPQMQAKQRYAPYKLTLPNPQHNKHKRLKQNEPENIATAPKTTHISKPSKPTANQSDLSPDLTNSVAKVLGRGKSTSRQNGLVPEVRYVVKKASTRNDHKPHFIENKNKNASRPKSRGNSVQNASNSGSVAASNSRKSLHESQQVVRCSVEPQREQHSEVLNVHHNEDDVLSMEEGARSELSLPLSTSDVVDMEIDNAEELAGIIVQELKEMRRTAVNEYNAGFREIFQGEMAMKVSSEGYQDNLYIVLDTNVLLSHLKFVAELKDFPIPGIGRPVLVLPWVVIQELDSLKENRWKRHEDNVAVKTTRVDTLARAAIKFLNNSFQNSDPRVRGQTADEASQRLGNFQEENNDDRILQCCLVFQERAENGNCVLFSNDVNLCNKTLVHGVKAFNYENLIPGLKDLFQCGAIVKQHSEEYNVEVAREEKRARQRQKADDILCELQIILREGVSYIIESEMKKAYDDLWLQIVYIKPPWTLIDVLQLLEKHWIAVFGHVLKRDHKAIVDKLRQKFDDRKGTPSSLVFCSEMLQIAMRLFQSFAAHSNYDDAIPKCLAAVNVLVQKCQQFQADSSLGHASAQPKCLTYPSKVPSAANNNTSASVKHDAVVSGTHAPPHEEVTNTFNLIWTAVTQFSTQIFAALGYPNTITDEAPQDFPKASKDEAISFLHVLSPRLQNLVRCIQNILRDPWEKASQNDTLFVQLEQSVAVFLKEVLSRDNHATAEKLFNFCQDASTRTSLVQGLSQLDRASAMLQHCASCVVQSNTLQAH